MRQRLKRVGDWHLTAGGEAHPISRESFGQNLEREGLFQKSHLGLQNAPTNHCIVGIAALKEHLQTWLLSQECLGYLAATQTPHDHVGHQQIDLGASLEDTQGILAIFSSEHSVTKDL